jgi:hypothetical protein
MENTLPAPPNLNPLRRLGLKTIALIGALVVITLGVLLWQTRQAQPELQANGFPLSPAIEDRFGVRFTFLTVTAEAGLVDLRYRVVDEAKADNFGHFTETSPLLINETTGKRLESTKMGMHNHRVEPGRTYYILYRNTDFALASGDKVTLQIDDLKIEHIEVR